MPHGVARRVHLLERMKTERQRQQETALELGAVLFHYRCNDGEGFEAVAHREAGAFCVLNAERPGVYGEVTWSRPAVASDFRIYAKDAQP